MTKLSDRQVLTLAFVADAAKQLDAAAREKSVREISKALFYMRRADVAVSEAFGLVDSGPGEWDGEDRRSGHNRRGIFNPKVPEPA